MGLLGNMIEAFACLWASRSRTAFSLLGIAAGVGAVIAMVSVGSIVRDQSMKRFEESGIDLARISLIYKPGFRQPPLGIMARQLASQCPGLLKVAPFFTARGLLGFNGQKQFQKVIGGTPSFFRVNRFALKSGRFIHPLDQNSYHCVIGGEVEAMLRAQGVKEPEGTQILVQDRVLTVIGVVQTVFQGDFRAGGLNRAILIPASTFRRIFNQDDSVCILSRTGNHRIHEIKAQVQSFFKNRNLDQVQMYFPEDLMSRTLEQKKIFTRLLGAIGFISLFVGGIGVMNVMLTAVTERTREIGIRRALGARQKDILFQFLCEAVMLCFMGGLVGFCLGVGAVWAVTVYAKWTFMISWGAMAAGAAVATCSGLVFGIYPARKASLVLPIEALRSN